MVTSRKWGWREDDTEEVVITNIACQTKYRGVDIRAGDSASIHDVYIDGLIRREWDGCTKSILPGGTGYGKPSHPGKIKNIYGMNIIGSGRSLILIEAAITNCSFINGKFTGNGHQIITNIISRNLIKAH